MICGIILFFLFKLKSHQILKHLISKKIEVIQVPDNVWMTCLMQH